MGIIYQTIIRSHILKDIELVPIEPWTENSPILAAKYLKNVKNNCLETHHEIYIDAQNKRNLHIMNYPIHPKAHSVSFTNFACDEYDGAYFEITFRFENGQTQTEEVFTDSSSFSRFMLIVPELMNGKKAKSVSYEVGSSPATNCYDLKRYDGSKHSSTKDEFYKQFRCNDYGSRRCPVCYPDQQDSESETESESSVESVIHLTKESKDESEAISESEFNSVPELKLKSGLESESMLIPESESESSVESVIHLTKESKDESEAISESEFNSVPELELKSDLESESMLIPELELKSIKSVPESTTKSESESESTLTSPESSGSMSDGKLVKSNIISGQLQSIFHKIRAIFKYLDTNGILRHETISRRKRKFGKSKSLPTMARQLSTLSDVFITTLNY